VTIDGFHLPVPARFRRIDRAGVHPAVSPPHVIVGKQEVEALTFGKDGRQIRGVLPRRPEDDRVVVDHGFAHAEARLATS